MEYIHQVYSSLSLLFLFLLFPDDLFPQDKAVGLLKISVVVIQSLVNLKVTGEIKFLANFIDNMHVKVDAFDFWFFSQVFFQLDHHLPSNSVFSVRLKYNKSENISMKLFLIILQSDSIPPNDNIIVIGKPGKLCILCGNFHVETSRIFDRQSIKVEFSKYVDIFIIDLSKSNR